MTDRRIQIGTINTLPKPPLMSFFDNVLLNSLDLSNYPPYNIIKDLTNKDRFYIEVATTGFHDDELEVSVEDNTLHITATNKYQSPYGNYIYDVNKTETSDGEAGSRYILNKLAKRNFRIQFKLDQYVEVLDATNARGLLTISLDRKEPDQVTKKIEINKPKNTFELKTGTINGSLVVESDSPLNVKLDGYSKTLTEEDKKNASYI